MILNFPAIEAMQEASEAGSKHNEIMHITDLYPTLARIAGADVPEDRIIDGLDQVDFLTGKSEQSPREGFPLVLRILTFPSTLVRLF